MDEDLEKLTKALLQDRSAARIGEQNVLLFGHSTMDEDLEKLTKALLQDRPAVVGKCKQREQE